LDIGQKLVTSAPAAGRSTASSGPADGSYRVRPGDTLAVIANRFNVSVKDLMDWNGLKSSRIRAGAYLRVRSDAGGDD
jgi:LysM repeat protein